MELQTRQAVRISHLKKPVYFELGDGRKVAVRELAHLTVELQRAEGPVRLEEVAFRVLPKGSEVLIGEPEIKRLKLPDLKEALAAKAAKDWRGE